jgi:hypothetical protein
MESQRSHVLNSRAGGIKVYDSVCPRCSCKSYYDHRPQVAWCWASGLIEIGDSLPASDTDGGGPIIVARGPKAPLVARLKTLAREGLGASRGKLLVPGVPEAPDETAKAQALASWLTWCGKGRASEGVVFTKGFRA